jgi:hypothetical protein
MNHAYPTGHGSPSDPPRVTGPAGATVAQGREGGAGGTAAPYQITERSYTRFV